MDVHADVAGLRQQRLAGVDAHPRPQSMRRERRLRGPRGGDRVRRAREGDEERVALGVDLDAVVRLPGSAERRAVQGELGCVRRRTDLVQQRGRAFDVGEEERDGAGWPLWHGNRIAMRACCRKRAGRSASSSLRVVTATCSPTQRRSRTSSRCRSGSTCWPAARPFSSRRRPRRFAVKDGTPEERRGVDVYPSVRWLGRPLVVLADAAADRRVRRRALLDDRRVEGVLREPDHRAHLGRLLGRARHRLVARRRRLGARLAA